MRPLVAILSVATLLAACGDHRSGRASTDRCERPELRAEDPWFHHELPAKAVSAAQTWGGGALVGDFRHDGTLDLVLVDEDGARVFGGPDLVERTADVGPPLTELDHLVGGAAVDLDDDGWTDLVLARWDAPNAILRNDRRGRFVDATPAGMQAHAQKTQSATVGDIDGDGDLDLFFGNYGERPPQFHHTPPGEPSELYRNDGDGWTDLSDTLPARIQDGYTFMSALHDLDGDHLPELLVFHDFSEDRPSVIGWNRGGMQLEAEEAWRGVGLMGIATAELDGDGTPDFLITSSGRNYLFRSDGPDGAWIDSTQAWGLTADTEEAHQDFGWGAEFGDLDNDGDEDAVVAYGYWEDWAELGAAQQRDAVFEQLGPQQFADRAEAWGLADTGIGRGVLLADFDRDGWLDVVKRQLAGPTLVKQARCGEAGWLRVQLEGPPGNRRGIGAKVELTANGRTQTRWIHSGQSSLYSGAVPEAHFGLGRAEAFDEVVVHWPDGETSTLGPGEPFGTRVLAHPYSKR